MKYSDNTKIILIVSFLVLVGQGLLFIALFKINENLVEMISTNKVLVENLQQVNMQIKALDLQQIKTNLPLVATQTTETEKIALFDSTSILALAGISLILVVGALSIYYLDTTTLLSFWEIPTNITNLNNKIDSIAREQGIKKSMEDCDLILDPVLDLIKQEISVIQASFVSISEETLGLLNSIKDLLS